MNPTLSYQEFTEGLKGMEDAFISTGSAVEGAKRLAFVFIWLKFQFGWRLGKWEGSLSRKLRPWLYLGILILLSVLVLLPAFVKDFNSSKSITPVAIYMPLLPTDPVFAPDTLLNQVSLNQLCNDE